MKYIFIISATSELSIAIAMLLLLCLLVTTPAIAEDSWTSNDKVLHAGVSSAIGVVTGRVFDSWGWSLGTCMIPGTIKEAVDATSRSGWSWEDLAADAVGCTIGVSFSKITINYQPDIRGISVTTHF